MTRRINNPLPYPYCQFYGDDPRKREYSKENPCNKEYPKEDSCKKECHKEYIRNDTCPKEEKCEDEPSMGQCGSNMSVLILIIFILLFCNQDCEQKDLCE